MNQFLSVMSRERHEAKGLYRSYYAGRGLVAVLAMSVFSALLGWLLPGDEAWVALAGLWSWPALAWSPYLPGLVVFGAAFWERRGERWEERIADTVLLTMTVVVTVMWAQLTTLLMGDASSVPALASEV